MSAALSILIARNFSKMFLRARRVVEVFRQPRPKAAVRTTVPFPCIFPLILAAFDRSFQIDEQAFRRYFARRPRASRARAGLAALLD